MRSREYDSRILPAGATDLRNLIERYAYPLLVCDEDGCVRFYNGSAGTLFGGNDLLGRPLPPEWMDKEKVELETEQAGTTVFRLLWEEILWEGNPAWYLVTFPTESDAAELKSKLEHSMEMAATEVEKRQQVESDRERLEAKLRDLHQRSVSKLEAARTALENEKAERQSLLERLTKLKNETDELKSQLEEKKTQVEEAGHRSTEIYENLQAELLSKQAALVNAEEKSERYRKVYEEIDGEMTKSQEQGALLSAKLRTAEARLDRAQRLLDGGSLEAIVAVPVGASESEIEALRHRVVELESELRRAQFVEPTPLVEAVDGREVLTSDHSMGVATLEAECQRLHEQLDIAQSKVAEFEAVARQAPSTSPEDPAQVAILRRRLEDTEAVVSELRMHKEQELLEARGALAKLQDLYASSKASLTGVSCLPKDDDAVELGLAHSRIVELEAALATGHSEQAVRLAARVVELEALLVDAESRPEIVLPSPDLAEQWQARVAELEEQLSRAENDASPQELALARNRISELELHVSQLSHAPSVEAPDGDRERLETELALAQGQLNEMGREVRRLMDGDRETKKMAYADQLTGLPNYNLTGQYLQGRFEQCGRGEGALALIMIDLDHFRRINDTLGTKAGDELLRQVGARLQRTVTEKDTAIARRGEDEFMVVAFLEGATVDGEALSARVRGIAHNLLGELVKPFDISGQRVLVTASLGVALYPGPAPDREALLEQAEHAMYKAKEAGRARVSFYTHDVHQNRDRRIRVERELRQAVTEGQFTMLYQPIVELPSTKVVGLEALLRWSHPQRGLLEPAEFLSLAEEIGVILPISDQVLEEALVVAKQKFMKNRFLSINLSHRQLVDAGFPARFMKHLERAQVKPNEVMVEISERNTRMDPERSRQTLAALAQWGVGIALDDFGSGSSELSLFREFHVKLVKIDGALVAKLPGDREAAKLCFAIARMAQALEIPVLAEGVETREQYEMVSSFGCQYAQGLHFREPMNVNQLSQIL